MAMTDLMLKYLLEKEALKIPNFGTFFLKDATAFLDEKSAAILPPGKEITFEIDYDLEDSNITNYLALNKNASFSEISAKLKETTTFWKNTLETKQELEIPEFGGFYLKDNQLTFKGKHFSTESPENFGLEVLNLSELKKKNNVQGYKASRNAFWFVLLILPVAAIVYFSSQKPDLIFGKKSFKNINKSTVIPVLKTKNIEKDSLKKDSLKPSSFPQK